MTITVDPLREPVTSGGPSASSAFPTRGGSSTQTSILTQPNPFSDGNYHGLFTSSSPGHAAVPSGVYSGADIKLLIHLPPTSSEEGGSSTSELDILQQQLQDLDQRIINARDAAVASGEGESISELRADRNVLSEQIAALQTEIASVDTSIYQANTKVLAEVQTLSLSVHREKVQYRPLGCTYPRSVCRGPRTIAGSLVFTIFHQHVFHEFFGNASYRSTGGGDFDRFRWTSYVMDQLPPLDISIVMANEYGNISWMGIFGVDLFNESMVMSIEDMFLEGTCQYIARDWDPLRTVGSRAPRNFNSGVSHNLTGSSLLMNQVEARVRGRRNPFL
jgi:hypothetical protein